MRILWLAMLCMAVALPAHAQAPITLIVNFVAGGPSDLMGRLLAPELSQRLGTQVLIRNSIGAAGGIGAAEAARARPDGTTLLLSPIGAMVIQPNFRADLPYRPSDLTPICQIADTPVVMMSAPGGPRSLAEVLSRARGGRCLQLRLHRPRQHAPYCDCGARPQRGGGDDPYPLPRQCRGHCLADARRYIHLRRSARHAAGQ